MTGLGDIGRSDGDSFSFACEMLADDRGVERQLKVSFSKRLRYVCSEKHPYLPNWRKFIRSRMAMNNFMVSINVFSKGLCIFTTDLRADRHSDWYCIRSVSLALIR